MKKYIRLLESPILFVRNPECGTCLREVISDGYGWLCPSCGSAWEPSDDDGDRGLLYEQWSDEVLDGPFYTRDDIISGRHLK